MSLTITLPLPSSKLSPNARVHWAEKSRLVRDHRKLASIYARDALKGAKPPGWVKATMRVVAYTKTANRPDPGNFMASLKSYEDGIADVGIIVNDRDLWPECPEFRKDAKNPRVEITIQPDENPAQH